VEGRVVDETTGLGLGAVEVRLRPLQQVLPPDPAAPQLPSVVTPDVVTEDSGAFRFAEVPNGSYIVQLQKAGYGPSRRTIGSGAVNVPGETHVDMKMMRLSSLRGRVVDSDKNPIPGVTVSAGSEASPPRLRSAVTDADGAFVLEDLSPGAYVLSVPLKIPSDAAEGERMVTTFYPASADRERAQRIEVRGTDVSGYEIQMQTAAVRKIHGVVTDVNGEPLAQATVGLIRPGAQGQEAEDVEQVLSDDDGKFEFAPAIEGEYRVQADYSLDYDDDLHRPLTRSASRRVRISKREMDPVELRLAPGFSIQVTVDWGDGGDAAAKHPDLRVRVSPMDREPIPSAASGDKLSVDGLFPGRYHFEEPSHFARLTGSYIAAMTLDGRDVLDQDVELSGPGLLRVVLRKDGGSVRGRVADGSGATVWLMGASGRLFSVACTYDGEFTIGDVPPGEYLAAANSGHLFLGAVDIAVDIKASGERVKVEAGATATLALKAK
jgi:Carboxypeptidase regulatory-like domain